MSHQSLDALSVEQTFLTESSFHPTFSVAPRPFLEPNPLMIAFSRLPPLYRRLSHPQSPGHISLPTGALLRATPAPEFRSVYSVSPSLSGPLSLPLAAGGRTQKQICNNHVGKIPVYSPLLFLQLRSLLSMEFSSKMFNSGVNFEDISVIFYLLFKKRKRKEKNAKV